jgi:uncharacterized LabA/DUF88 family protein
MAQTALFIDAGFLLAGAGRIVANTSYRDAIVVDFPKLITGIAALTEASGHPGDETHRVLWYDAARDGLPTDEQKAIGLLPDVKVRLGRISYSGEQKGVDLRIALDLISTARAGVVKTAYLLSGDDDLTEAVEEAQVLGMKVIVVAPQDTHHKLGVSGVAERLAMEADRIVPLPEELLRSFVSKAYELRTGPIPTVPAPVTGPKPTPPSEQLVIAKPRPYTEPFVPTAPPTASVYYSTASGAPVATKFKENLTAVGEIGASLAKTWYLRSTPAQQETLLSNKPELPRDVDAALLRDCAKTVGETVMESQGIRHQARHEFWTEIEQLTKHVQLN